jgi:hypothetical protein
MTPGEAGQLITEMANALEKLQDRVEELALSLEGLRGRVEAIDARLAPPTAAEA